MTGRYRTPSFQIGEEMRSMLADLRTEGERSRPVLLDGPSKAREAARILSDFRKEPEHDVWRALASLDERVTIRGNTPDARSEFLLMPEMGRTTKEGMELAVKARLQFPHEWRRVGDVLKGLAVKKGDIDLLTALMTWLPRDDERREMLTDLREIVAKFVEWFDELAPPIQTGAPRAAEVDPARRFAGYVFATLSDRGFGMRSLLALTKESPTVWRPAPIREPRLRELSRKRVLRDTLTALMREGSAALREK